MELPGGAGLALGSGSWVVEGRQVKLRPSEMGLTWVPSAVLITTELEPDLGYWGARNFWKENGQGIVV